MYCNRKSPSCRRRGLVSLVEMRQVKMGRVGFEPTTNALKGHCSSTELPTQTKERGYVLPVMETSYPEHNSHFTLKISFTTRLRLLFCLTSFQILQTRFELVRLAPTDFKSVVYTVPPPEDTLILYHQAYRMQELSIQLFSLTKK